VSNHTTPEEDTAIASESMALIELSENHQGNDWNLSVLVETKFSLSENTRRRGYGNEKKDLHRRIQA